MLRPRDVLLSVAAMAALGAEADAQFLVNGTQRLPEASDLVSLYAVDFAIPASPAFNLLSPDPSDILRPSTGKNLMVSLSGLVSEEGLEIPEVLGLELAPAMLAKGRDLTFDEYSRRAWLYRTTVSLSAAHLESGEPSAVAMGFRIPFVDKGDLRENQSFVGEALARTRRVVDLLAEARRRAGPPPARFSEEDLEAMSRAIKKDWEYEEWNARRLEVAGALRVDRSANGDESTEGRVGEIGGWFVWGEGLSDWGQLILGGKLSAERDTTMVEGSESGTAEDELKAQWSLGGRLYLGQNVGKVFLEAQVTSHDREQTLLNGGTEFRILDGIWVTASGGITWPQGKGDPDLKTSFQTRVSLPSGG